MIDTITREKGDQLQVGGGSDGWKARCSSQHGIATGRGQSAERATRKRGDLREAVD